MRLTCFYVRIEWQDKSHYQGATGDQLAVDLLEEGARSVTAIEEVQARHHIVLYVVDLFCPFPGVQYPARNVISQCVCVCVCVCVCTCVFGEGREAVVTRPILPFISS